MAEVFISYKHINDDQSKSVRSFGEKLHEYGIEVLLDQFYRDDHPQGPAEGWPKWSSDRAKNTQRILIIGNESWFDCFDGRQPPGTGLGAACEAGIIRQRLYDMAGNNENIRVVLFDPDDARHISEDLKRYHYFHAVFDFPQIVKWLYSSPHSDKFCAEETELRRQAPARSEFSRGDTSDLSLLFLSVKDCDASRRIIRRFVMSLPKRESCGLHGMYALLGRWDLVVRLRCPNSKFDEHQEKLHRELLKDQMDENDPDFRGYQYINVLREVRSFRELLDDSLGPAELKRRILGSTRAYEDKRCQRGFLYIRLPKTDSEEQELIDLLSNKFDDDSKFQAIVEGIYKGRDDLVVETFMSCAQSQEMNSLNRKIEKHLTRYELQKYTMFCYGYDEDEILAN